MALQVQFSNDVTGALELTHGSDGRLNVSSRSDNRSYYIPRDQSETYSAVFFDTAADAADYVFFLQNTNTQGKHLVIDEISVSTEAATCILELDDCSSPSGGAAIVPTCLNRASTKTAAVTCQGPTDSSGSPMTCTDNAAIDIVSIDGAFGHADFHPADRLRLGQDDGIGIRLKQTGTADRDVFGVVYFFFE